MDLNEKDEVYLKNLIIKANNFKEKGENSKYIDTLFEIASFFFNHDEFEKASLNLNKILNLNPNQSNVNYYLALIEIKRDNYDQAKKFLKRELKINPENLDAKKLLDTLFIENNFPYLSLSISFISIFVYFLFKNQLNNINFLLEFALSSVNLNYFNLITNIFIHTNLFHLVVNIIFLLVFGLILEKEIGSFKFGLVFFLSAILGNLFEVLLNNQASFVVGFSGGIFGILGFLSIIKPFFKINLFGFIKTNLIIVFSAYFIVDLILETVYNFNVAILSHYFGFLIGLTIGNLFYLEKVSVFYGWILMSMGFYILINSLKDLIYFFEYSDSINYFVLIFSVLIGLYLIIFPYNLLKKIEFKREV
jgi:membrane associated rhomboid family serine protease